MTEKNLKKPHPGICPSFGGSMPEAEKCLLWPNESIRRIIYILFITRKNFTAFSTENILLCLPGQEGLVVVDEVVIPVRPPLGAGLFLALVVAAYVVTLGLPGLQLA